MPDAPTLSVVIVSYNVRDELAACLRSLEGHADAPPLEVIVVDNASSDGSVDMVKNQFPAVRVIEAGDNVGYARANNIGIRASTGSLVLLLNPDTVVPPGSIATLARALASHADAAAAGPRLVDAQGVPELSFGWTMGPFGELRQKVTGALYDRRVPFAVRLVERWTRTPGPREWVSGACLLVRRADLEAVGLLDERYLLYAEDVDLCVSLRRRGRTILFVPSAEVQHLRGRSVARSPRAERMRRLSQLAYYQKHHPVWVPWLRLYLRACGKLPSDRPDRLKS